MVCTMPDLWQKGSSKSLGWILQTMPPLWLMMSHSELWWQECLMKILKGKVVDIDNAFRNGDLEHEIYMKIPEGYDEVVNRRVDKKRLFNFVEANIWIGTSNKPI